MMRSKLVSRPGARARFVLVAAQLLALGCARGPQLPPVQVAAPRPVEPPMAAVIRPQPEPTPQPSAPAVALEDPSEPHSVDLVIDTEEAETFNTELPGPLPLHGAIVMQKVEDYATWRAVFDAELEARKRAGFAAQGVMRGIDDPKLVVVWLAVTDVAHAKAYLSDKSVLTRFRRAGAIGAPQIQLSSNIDAKMEPGRKGLSAAVIALRVKEWPLFKVAFAAQSGARRAAGVIGYALSQDVDDEHLFYVYLQSEDPAQLKAYLSSRETKQAWRDAGLESGPFVKFVREGELALCR
jgi:quinol monooxygenase YgiN